MKRLFLALKPEEEDARALWDQWEPLRFSSPRVRWLDPEEYHVTLHFIGDTEEHLIPQIIERMERAGECFHPFVVETAGPGQFPSRGDPRVLIESLRDRSLQLKALHLLLYRSLTPLFPLEKRKFHPHFTLARLRNYSGKTDFLPLGTLSFSLKQMVLYESRLHPGGAEYSPLYSLQLKG